VNTYIGYIEPDPLLPLDEHHPALNITIDYNQFNLLMSTDCFYDFKHYCYIGIVKFLVDNLLHNHNTFINFSLNELIDHLYKAISTFLLKNRFSSNCFPSWYSNELKTLLRQKKIAHSWFKKFNDNDPSDYNSFSRLRAYCKRTAKLDYKNYINKVQLYLSN